jgi:hypothetical protein
MKMFDIVSSAIVLMGRWSPFQFSVKTHIAGFEQRHRDALSNFYGYNALRQPAQRESFCERKIRSLSRLLA